MSIVNIDWSQFLTEDSELPPDVTFCVIENVTDPVTENHDDRKTGQVTAHKLLLAGSSPVFRKQFFGALRETKDVVEIKDTTIEAFTTMINYIYVAPAPSKFSLGHVTCPQGLCDILNIAERFQLPDLFNIVENALKSLPITSENIMFVAATAKNYAVFEDISKMMTEKCKKFLRDNLRTAEDAFSFIVESNTNYPEIDPGLLPELFRGIELKSLPITSENIMFVAATAKNYAMFEDISKMMTEKCMKFLSVNLRTAEDAHSFIVELNTNYPEIDPGLLPELIRGIDWTKCNNCLRSKSECLDGEYVTGEEDPAAVRTDLVVKYKYGILYCCRSVDQGRTFGTVEKLWTGDGIQRWKQVETFANLASSTERFYVRVKCLQHRNIAGDYYLLDNGTYNFSYACKK